MLVRRGARLSDFAAALPRTAGGYLSGGCQCQRADPLNRGPGNTVTANDRQADAFSATRGEMSPVGDCRGDVPMQRRPGAALRPEALSDRASRDLGDSRAYTDGIAWLTGDRSGHRTAPPTLVSTPAWSKAAAGLQARPQARWSLTAVCAIADIGISAIVAAQAPAPTAARSLCFAFGFMATLSRRPLVFIVLSSYTS